MHIIFKLNYSLAFFDWLSTKFSSYKCHVDSTDHILLKNAGKIVDGSNGDIATDQYHRYMVKKISL